MIVTLNTQLPNNPATPKSAALNLTDAKKAEASGIDVTMEETIIPKVLEATPVSWEILSTL